MTLTFPNLDAPTVRYLEANAWDNGRGYSFAPWVKSCGENVGKLKARSVEHIAERPAGHWEDGEWVSEEVT